ncbi:hypothetical protein [Streptomyces sp. NPDC058644]|uniref:hypothetical protein n=1 Tax=unclassified Streptomyces TaxID=2593676 RepID=UPI00365B3F8B
MRTNLGRRPRGPCEQPAAQHFEHSRTTGAKSSRITASSGSAAYATGIAADGCECAQAAPVTLTV